MSDDDSNKESEWNFSLENETNEKKEIPIRKKQRVNKTAKLKLDFQSVPEKRSRRTSNESVAKYKTKDNTYVASISQRIKSFVIDLFTIVLLGFASNLLKEISTEHLLPLIGSDLSFKDFRKDELIVAVNFFLLFLLLYIFPVFSMKRTIGKVFTKIEIEDINNGLVGGFRVVLREIVLKPISILTIIGIVIAFTNKKKRSLHDYLTATYIIPERQD
jgi:uncharacterized RDD family membrane protein YckC